MINRTLFTTLSGLTILLVRNFVLATAVAQSNGQATADSLQSMQAQPVTGQAVPCVNGRAKSFECRNVELLAFLPPVAVGAPHQLIYGRRLTVLFNGLWGWHDSATGREFAILGRTDGVSFIEVTDPVRPTYLGVLPLTKGATPSFWRDIKVYRNHAFIIADAAGDHGMQVFDLTQLRDVVRPPVVFQETAHYDQLGSAHTLAVDEATGYLFAAGTMSGRETCGGGLHMIDVREPAMPKFAGCYADQKIGTTYIHETQCAIYHGPDRQYQGHEICFNATADLRHAAFNGLLISDVTDKQAPVTLSLATYPNVSYAHQGWLTEDHRYFFFGDETDEEAGLTSKTRTIVFDVTRLDDPVVAKEFLGPTAATDHNLYIRGRYMFQTNYKAGLRVIDVHDPQNPTEVGYFDTTPMDDNMPGYAGTWTNYPYFKTAHEGIVALSSISEGFFLVRFRPPQ